MSVATEEFLSHYGVKGMKWGKRKGEPGGSSSGAVKEAPSEDAARVGNIHSRVKSQKSTKQLSNKELQDAITRMQLEQQYSKMTNGLDKTKKQKASAFIGELIKGSSKQGLQQVANDEVKSAFKNAAATARKKAGG